MLLHSLHSLGADIPSFLNILLPPSLRRSYFFVLSSLCCNLPQDFPAHRMTHGNSESVIGLILSSLPLQPHSRHPAIFFPYETLAMSKHADRHTYILISFSLCLKHLSLPLHRVSSSLKTQPKCPIPECFPEAQKKQPSFLCMPLGMYLSRAFIKFSSMCLHYPLS